MRGADHVETRKTERALIRSRQSLRETERPTDREKGRDRSSLTWRVQIADVSQ